MKTSEFKMRIKQLGYCLGTYDTRVEVLVGYSGWEPSAEIWNTKIGACKINTGNIELIKLCIEYAETPIEEREDEKKYTVVLPDPRNDRTHCQALFKGLYGICIGYVYRHDLQSFTEAEIKRNHEYLWRFAKEVVE